MSLDVQHGGTWRSDAACLDAPDPDGTFFPVGEAGKPRAKALADARVYCLDCTVRAQCAERALDPQVRFGIWAGVDLGDGGEGTRQAGKAELRALADVLRVVAS